MGGALSCCGQGSGRDGVSPTRQIQPPLPIF
ncbi:hypothetical protein KIPB_004353, partial [Kipferlia bialata]|eukprot:g4353.t1